MAKRSFKLSTTVPGPPASVITVLTDAVEYRDLRPFVLSAQVVGTGTSDVGPWCEWDGLERSRLGPLTYRLRVRRRITRTSSTSLDSYVRTLPGCHVRAITRAEESVDGRTLLTESVVTIAPFPVVGYLARRARATHSQTYERLPAVLAQ